MGSAKALLTNEDDVAFVVALSRAFIEAGLAAVIVTVPPAPTDTIIVDLLSELPVHICFNEAPHLGLSGSVETALSKLPNNQAGLVFSPVDVPVASADLIGAMVEALTSPRSDWLAAVASHNGAPGHPVAFTRHLFGSLRTCGSSGGPRNVLRAHTDRVLEYEWNDPNILVNLNTPEAYRETFGKSPRRAS